MATANELFAADGEDYIVIDSDLRTMTFPASVNNIGVENDKDVHKLNFKMPRYYSGYDLSEFIIHINYVNANGDADMYYVLDPTVEENEIIFSWLVGRHACLYRGSVTFIVCLKLADGEGDVAQEFNTTLASLQVLPGLETEPTILETEHDVIEQLLLSINDTNAKIKAVLDTGLTPEQIAEFYNKSKTYGTEIAAINSNSHLLSKAPHNLTSGTDLNNINTPGVYDCDSSTVATSLLHCPVITGFRLIVEQSGYGSMSYGYQTIMLGSGGTASSIGGIVYRRVLPGTTSTAVWGDWKQLPTSAEIDALNSSIDALNSNLIVPNNRTNIPDNSDIDTYITPGVYAVASDASASTMTNMPRNASGKLIVMVRGNNLAYIQQKYITTSSAYIEYVRNYNNGAWTAWEQLPTRAEVDALNSRTDGIKTDNLSMDTAGTYTKTLNLSAIYLVTVGRLNTSNGDYNGMYLVTTHRVVSSIRTLVSSDAVDSITINAGTLSITTKTPYTIASIMRLALIS